MVSVISKITAKNQVTVPKQVRQALGLKEHDQLRWIAKDDGSIDTPKPAWGPDVGGEVID